MTDTNETTELAVTQQPDVIKVEVRRIAQGEDVAIQTYDNRNITLSIKEVKLLVKGGLKCNDLELAAYLSYCAGNGYDPLRNQCYLIKYKDSEPAEWVVSYHVYLDRANRNAMFDGFSMGVVWRVDGEKVKGQPCDYETDATHKIIGAWAEVERKDRSRLFYREVPMGEMMKTRRDRDSGKQVPTRTWANMLTTMAVKVPLCRALRDAFPDELGGSYADVERMGPPTVSEAAANVLPREERKPDLTPEEPPADPEPPSSVALLAQRVKGQIEEQRPGVEVTREMQKAAMLALASMACDGEAQEAFTDGERWTEELVSQIGHLLDVNGPLPDDLLPPQPQPPEEGGDDD